MAPMATVVIGGLLVSTFITLFLVPVVYSLFDNLLQRLRRTLINEVKAETETV